MHPFVNNKTKLKTTTSRHRHGAAVAAADLTEPPPYGGGLGDNNNQRTRLFLFECGGDGGVGCGGTAAGEEGEGKTASGASGVDGRVDRVTRKLFEAHRKTPPEKFSGGGAMVAGGGRVAGVKPDPKSQRLKSSFKDSKILGCYNFALDSLSKLTQSVTSKNDSMSILECPHLIQRMTTSP
ncbi:hypothetical protein Tco_1195135 [Tanacetum coccineum]